jgi:hypothetical protein
MQKAQYIYTRLLSLNDANDVLQFEKEHQSFADQCL